MHQSEMQKADKKAACKDLHGPTTCMASAFGYSREIFPPFYLMTSTSDACERGASTLFRCYTNTIGAATIKEFSVCLFTLSSDLSVEFSCQLVFVQCLHHGFAHIHPKSETILRTCHFCLLMVSKICSAEGTMASFSFFTWRSVPGTQNLPLLS